MDSTKLHKIIFCIADYQDGVYNYITLSVTGQRLTSEVLQWKYATVLQLAEVKVLGIEQSVTKVEIDGQSAQFIYNADVKVCALIYTSSGYASIVKFLLAKHVIVLDLNKKLKVKTFLKYGHNFSKVIF